MARQVGEVWLARLPASHGHRAARSASQVGAVVVRRPCSRQQPAPGRKLCSSEQRPGQLVLYLVAWREQQAERERPYPQRLLSHEASLLRHGLVANRDRRPVEAAWLER